MSPLVYIVDDDDAVRESLQRLFESVAIAVSTHASAQGFLDHYDPRRPGCLVLDVRMPGMGGLDLLDRLRERGIELPVIIITGHGDVPAAVRALKSGALDFIQKPFNPQVLLDRVQQAIEQDQAIRRRAAARSDAVRRLSKLTAREHEVLELVLAGKANKVIAIDLAISERTVEFHRANIMKKMQARSLPELVNLVQAGRRPSPSAERAE